MRPADMLSRLFQHLLRMVHMMSFAFGHSAAQSAAPLCGAPAPLTCAHTPQNMPFGSCWQSGCESRCAEQRHRGTRLARSGGSMPC